MTQKKRMAATKRADKLFSELIRSRGRCELAVMRPETKCAGPLQCCHVVSRSYRAVRWDEMNALAGCAAHHLWFTHHPLEWERAIGETRWHHLRALALSAPPEKAADAVARLTNRGAA